MQAQQHQHSIFDACSCRLPRVLACKAQLLQPSMLFHVQAAVLGWRCCALTFRHLSMAASHSCAASLLSCTCGAPAGTSRVCRVAAGRVCEAAARLRLAAAMLAPPAHRSGHLVMVLLARPGQLHVCPLLAALLLSFLLLQHRLPLTWSGQVASAWSYKPPWRPARSSSRWGLGAARVIRTMCAGGQRVW